MVPKGIYCYDENELCPQFKVKFINGVAVYFCQELNQYGLDNNMTDEEFKILKQFHKTDDIDKLYPLFLLWDKVKECGINTED